MSKFFRSADSSSSSESDSAEGSDDELFEVTENNSSPRVPSDLQAGDDASKDRLQNADSHEAATQNNLAVDPRSISESHHAIDSSSQRWNSSHRDILLHALLEERCINEAIDSHSNAGSSRALARDSSEVQARAKAMYQDISAKLASLNLISSGLQTDHHAVIRQRYRDGLDILSQQKSTAAVPPRLRRLLTDMDVEIAPHGSLQNAGQLTLRSGAYNEPARPYPLRRLLTDAENINQQRHDHYMHLNAALGGNSGVWRDRFHEPRYFREFEELSMLGRGGYGIVYHVRHRLDNQFYAIKKVPLSAARLQRIKQKGPSELDEVLRELRTLARLDHPNIVRYYQGWIEWVDHTPSTGLIRSGNDSHAASNETGDAEVGAEEDSEFSHRQVNTRMDDEHANIVFEDSGLKHTASDASASAECFDRRKKGGSAPSNGPEWSQEISGDAVDGSKGTVESIGRKMDASSSIQSGFDTAHFKEPTLALHMQMSLHPMTLADYLSPASDTPTKTGAAPPLSHCYHLEPSVSILLAIWDGIEYLHHEGIVHRDIKPGNIFLGRKENPRSTRGSVDLMLCSECRAQRRAAPIRLEIRIGDFGLVTFANAETQRSREQRAVGTEIYRPAFVHPLKDGLDEIRPTASASSLSPDTEPRYASQLLNTSSASLDIYALGIIAFEMLWKFNTRMERLHTIQQLKQGIFPPGFSDRLGKHGRKVTECIRAMMSQNGDDVSIAEIKQVLSMLQSPTSWEK